ncbi:MAG: helix-turn-helix domain-containing protein [Alphaproteobacteria bacterium]|nr:MAG: helix-turn-helix domain-containing protein [Alphaproteobacteria bacterium]
MQYLDGEFVLLEQATPTRLLFGEGLLTRRRADDLIFPSRGVSVTYTARLSAGGLLSDTNLASLRADLKWVRPAGDRSRVILRASGGALQADRFDRLPPELRFFAGGDRSVRGFDYQQIGERRDVEPALLARLRALNPKKEYDDTGVIGGHYLATVSGEFEHYFTEQWGGAVFVDAGDAFDSKPNANVGAGVGVRWKSPVGIIRVDFAVPVRTDQDTQRLSIPTRIGVRHPKLSQVIQMMEGNIEDPMSPADLAEEVGMSTRQLERLFRRYLNRSPKRYYMELRLQKARNLLMQTDMSVINVALACGFASPSHFSKCYRSHYSTTPYRERGTQGMPGAVPVRLSI